MSIVHSITVAGHQLMAWSFGIAVTTVFLDIGPGFARDHPPFERRIAGALAGPLAGLSFCLLLVDNPVLTSLLIAAPFALMSSLYSLAWFRRWPANRRRTFGWQTGVVGGVALIVLMLTAGPQYWDGGVVMGVYAASAGLLGGFTCLTVKALYGHRATDVEDSSSPYGIPARTVAVGLGIGGLAALDMLTWAISGHAGWLPILGVWLVLSLVVPGVLMALGHKLYPRLQLWVWLAALISATGGQATIHTITLFLPGLIPPAAI
ncbi:MAG TPA: hypothetical protein VNT01_12965 [Symbiobacteriaceae bacterium]|nr:hypothetical protein [Symbiobacteriaceae bacterium]